ncbi:hypothetical protein C9374_000426 [Naegleria lovaniensis]|uniref:Uncharacterized protein n=1 Tax=Naegleria lovaniensis TaxID=51637 RepID=A0AA88GWE2_NAELO|nr:uncharacterized protein C9374_013223 [Naegleria lovaniensis]XP_044552254.1 uncharacterized protein C9374_000426 [Naegleria lovaniensis]KAG2372771.1 hypothetical protein C9374_013223 [Naegleria lovaniensis]KAG2388262.1 hypothetical protein C9374_000426 [Naegleria lovaniensis]
MMNRIRDALACSEPTIEENEKRVEWIHRSMMNLNNEDDVARICPSCLQPIVVVEKMNHHTKSLYYQVDELLEHVSICLNLWNNERRKLFGENNEEPNMNEISTKIKKSSTNNDNSENSLTKLDDVLGDDMLYHFLTFLDQSFLIHTCMRVSKH